MLYESDTHAAPYVPGRILGLFEKGVTQSESSEMTEGQESLSVPYGSYHQLYRIDGKLVAVGVVDILPKCLVSFRFSFKRKETAPRRARKQSSSFCLLWAGACLEFCSETCPLCTSLMLRVAFLAVVGVLLLRP